MKSLKAILWESFVKTCGIPITVLSIFMAFICWIFLPNTSIPLYYTVLVGIILFTVIATLVDALYNTYKQQFVLAEVITSRVDNDKLIILLKPSSLYSMGTFVSFYYMDDYDFEKLIGIGYVSNIQDNNKVIHATFSEQPGWEENQELIKKIKDKNIDILKRLIVKPTLTREAFKDTTGLI